MPDILVRNLPGDDLALLDDQELAGYRAALDYLCVEDWRPLNLGLLLHLHRLLFADTKASGGTFTQSDNLVVDRSPDGVQTVRFSPSLPLAPSTTPPTSSTRFADAAKADQHHRVLLVGLFIVDLIIVHPSTTAMVAWPWLGYFSTLLARGYARFAEGVAANRSGGTKSERVREHI